MANTDKKYNFNYYKIYKNDEIFDFSEWINNFNIDNISENYLEYKTFKVRCDDIKEVNDSDRWILHFSRLNPNDNPLVTKLTNSEIKKVKLDDDQILTNDLFSMYDRKNEIFICQNVRNIISITVMEKYINTFWKKYSFNYNDILEIRPVLQTEFIEKISKQKNLKKLTMKIANPPLVDRISTPTSIGAHLDEAESVNSNYIKLEFGIGTNKTRGESLNHNGVMNFVRSIVGMDKDLVDKLEIIGDETTKPIDLINGKIKRTITLNKAEYVEKNQEEIINMIRIKMQTVFTPNTIKEDIRD